MDTQEIPHAKESRQHNYYDKLLHVHTVGNYEPRVINTQLEKQHYVHVTVCHNNYVVYFLSREVFPVYPYLLVRHDESNATSFA